MNHPAGPPKNGTTMNSGPPRLRIDNVINMRMGTSADDDEDFRKRVEERRQSLMPPFAPDAQPEAQAKVATSPEDTEQGIDHSPEAKAALRNRAAGAKGDDDTT